MSAASEELAPTFRKVEKKIGNSRWRECFPQGKIATGVESHWKEVFEEKW